MEKIIVEARFKDMLSFKRMIETLKKTIALIKKNFPGNTFIILKIDGVRLKVEEGSDALELCQQYDERKHLVLEGRSKALNEYYKHEGIL